MSTLELIGIVASAVVSLAASLVCVLFALWLARKGGGDGDDMPR